MHELALGGWAALPARFEIRAPYDVLPGKIERGDWVICSCAARPRSGGAVLARDAAGSHHFLRYEARGDGWMAKSPVTGSRELVGDVDVHLVATVLGGYFDEDSDHG